MTTNRLATAQPSFLRSGKTAAQWAQIARDRNDHEGAAEWERAAREGWDDMHFDPTLRDALDREAKSWWAKKGTARG